MKQEKIRSLLSCVDDFPLGKLSLGECKKRWQNLRIEIAEEVWLDPIDRARMDAVGEDVVLVASNSKEPLAWRGRHKIQLIARHSFFLRSCASLLKAMGRALIFLEPVSFQGTMEEGNNCKNLLYLGKEAHVGAGVSIEGAVWIGDGCTIGPCAHLIGPLFIGNNCRIGHAVRVENCSILGKTAISHFTCLQHAVVGTEVNFGAGVHIEETSDFCEDDVVVIGRGARLGINTLLSKGAFVAQKAQTLPGVVV